MDARIGGAQARCQTEDHIGVPIILGQFEQDGLFKRWIGLEGSPDRPSVNRTASVIGERGSDADRAVGQQPSQRRQFFETPQGLAVREILVGKEEARRLLPWSPCPSGEEGAAS